MILSFADQRIGEYIKSNGYTSKRETWEKINKRATRVMKTSRHVGTVKMDARVGRNIVKAKK